MVVIGIIVNGRMAYPREKTTLWYIASKRFEMDADELPIKEKAAPIVSSSGHPTIESYKPYRITYR